MPTGCSCTASAGRRCRCSSEWDGAGCGLRSPVAVAWTALLGGWGAGPFEEDEEGVPVAPLLRLVELAEVEALVLLGIDLGDRHPGRTVLCEIGGRGAQQLGPLGDPAQGLDPQVL